MNVRLRSLGLALLLSSAAAPPAFALPDYVPFTLPGWSNPLVVRTTADATVGSAANSPAVAGGTFVYFSGAVANIGATAGTATTLAAMQLDGNSVQTFPVGALAASTATFQLNQPALVEGGLHTVSLIVDATSLMTESNETNNTHARQLAVTPVDLPVHTLATRNAPPEPTGGTAAVVGPVYPNQDGVRLPANDQPWQAVALRPPAGQDYDLFLYAATTATGNGFRTPLEASQLGDGRTDFILNNGNFVGAPAHDVGVQYFSGSLESYGIEHRQAVGQLSFGNTYPGLALASEQMLRVEQYQHLPNPAHPRVLFELTGTPGQVLHLSLFDPTSGANSLYSRSDAMADAVTDASGRAFLDMALPTTGSNRYYGVVVYRDQADGGTAPAAFTLRILQTPADLANEPVEGFTVPVNASNSGGNVTTEPTALDGDIPNTTMSFYYQNLGTQSAGARDDELSLDGASLDVLSVASPLAAGGLYGTSSAPFTVRGGRHTLSYRADVANSVFETSEANNAYAKQFVWSPTVLTENVSVVRAMPPNATGGWNDIPIAVPRYFNVDGLRTPTPSTGTFDGNVTAVMPGAGSDVDLDAFVVSTGPSNGFATPVATSQAAGDAVDLVGNFHLNRTPQSDLGVRRYSGPEVPYTIQSTLGTWLFPEPAEIGPSTIAAGDIMETFQFRRTSGAASLQVVLQNLSGGADLGLSVFKFSFDGPITRDGALPGGNVNGAGAGGNEIATISQVLQSDYVGIVVWKTAASELGKHATYRLLIDHPLVDAGPIAPREVSFALASANPMRSRAVLRFSLPQARDVSLDLLDVGGRRVRTLASGSREAGSHTVAWDLDDAHGRPVANGTYFARFTSGEYQRTAKVLVLR